MAIKAPRGRDPIRVKREPDPRYRLLIVRIGGFRVLHSTFTLAEVGRRLELWPESGVRAEISFFDEKGRNRLYFQYTGKGKRMTAYVSGMRDIRQDPTNQAMKPSWKRVPTEALIPHQKNDQEHVGFSPTEQGTGEVVRNTPHMTPDEIRKLRRFEGYE
jgi:hypothetical protein